MQHTRKPKTSLPSSGNNHYEKYLPTDAPPPPLRRDNPRLNPDHHHAASQGIRGMLQDNILTILGAVGFFLFLYLARPQAADARFRGRYRRAAQEKDEEEMEDPEVRQKRIADALATKVVIGQDADGNLTLGDRDKALELGSQSDTATDLEIGETEGASECVFCLEPFGLWDEVAWANGQAGCKHVWHADCIRTWLQEADDCPTCRSEILQTIETKPDPEWIVEGPGVAVDVSASSTMGDAVGEAEELVAVVPVDGTDFVILKGQDSIGVPAKREQ